ncbi:MAG: hypothetical protein K8S98_09110 [Planctomycetes bacterium]|nr:hypothetical protein [Planctomycetota bacterium]
MRAPRWLLTSFVALVVLAAAGTAWMKAGSTPAATTEHVVSAASSGVRGLLFAQPFVLDQPYEHTWRAERPSVRAGWLLVLDVEPELVVPRQGYEPVLFVGNQTAERINHGDGSGHLVVIVPSELDPATGLPALDLLAAPIWFGTPRLPEQVDAVAVVDEIAGARRVGIKPFTAQKVIAAKQLGSTDAPVKNRTELERYAATLVQTWASDEYDLAQGLLQPLVQ